MEAQSLFPRTRRSVRNDEIMATPTEPNMDRQNNNNPHSNNNDSGLPGALFSQGYEYTGSSSSYLIDGNGNEGDADSVSSFSTASASFTDEDVDFDVLTSDEEEHGTGSQNQNQNSHRKSFNGYVSDFKLIEKIMSYLNLDSLLACRLVCQKWCDVISNNDCLLWENASVIFSRRHLQAGSLSELNQTDLVKRFKCPNFKFYCLDLRHDLIRNFLTIYGQTLRHLSFITCYMSKATFDLILLDCPNLTQLEMNNVPRSVSMCRFLFPRELHFGPVLTKLRHLSLCRLEVPSSLSDLDSENESGRRTGSGVNVNVNVSRNKLRLRKRQRLLRQRHKITASSLSKSALIFKNGEGQNQGQDPRYLDNYNGENLSSIFLEQLLEACLQLQRISLSGWEGWTLYNLMTFLNSRPQFSTVTELCLVDLRGDVGDLSDPSIFFPLCSQASHLQFKKLTISLKRPILWKRPLTSTSKKQTSSSLGKPNEQDPEIYVPSLCHDFDTIFQLTLHHHRKTLEYLNLTNLPLTLHIFKDSTFPRMKSICLLSLRITDLEWRDRMDRLSVFMPKLEIIDFCPMPQSQLQSQMQSRSQGFDFYSQNKNGQMDFSGAGSRFEDFFRGFKNPFDFYRCTPFDFICLTSVLILYGLVAILLLVSQFNHYGEYFLGFGLWILVMLCLSDFYSDTWTNLQLFHT